MTPLQYTPYVLPFVASLAVTTALGVYAYRRRHLRGAGVFAALMAALGVWTLCYALELSTPTLEGKTFWAAAKYFGSAAGPALWFVLALHLTGNERWLNRPFRLALWAFAIVTCFVVFTNPYHHWFWTDIALIDGLPETQAGHGFYFWVYAAASYAAVITSVVLFFDYYRTTPALHRRQASLMALGGFLPLAGRILEDFLGVDVIPVVDNVILLFLVSGLLFALAIFRYGAFRIVHIGHNLVIHNISAGIVVLDLEQRVVELNPYARALVAGGAGAVGQPLRDALAGWPPLDVTSAAEQEVPVPIADPAAGPRWFHVQPSQIRAENGAPAGYAVVLFDVTARKRAEERLAAMARTDSLTGATNRGHFVELAQAELARAARYARPLTLVMLDIDHFKRVNDTHGHPAGDEVIRLVAAHCRRHLRATDLFARFGGEEFVALLPETPIQDARLVAERIRQSIATALPEIGGHTIPVTVSLGLAASQGAADGPTFTLDQLIARADAALYAAKAGGRNQVCAAGERAPELPLSPSVPALAAS